MDLLISSLYHVPFLRNILVVMDRSCVHFTDCSGCVVHLATDPPPLYGEIQRFFGKQKIEFFSGVATKWRYRAKLAVRGSSAQPSIGLYYERSHRVVDIPLCKAHHPKINQAVEQIRRWICDCRISPYDEKGAGDLRYLQLSVQRTTELVQLSLVVNCAKPWEEAVKSLWERDPKLWHSIWININSKQTNTIFGPEWRHLLGEFWFWQKIADVEIAYLPASFAQANVELFDQLIYRIKKEIAPGSKVVEFYCGAGAIGLNLQDVKLRCCESNPISKDCFFESLKQLSNRDILFCTAKAEECLDWLNDSDTLIVDPPRRGLGEKVISFLSTVKNLKKFFYISCGWRAFQIDCEKIKEAGWTVDQVDLYSLFPGTNQIELLVIFTKK